jgi:hypothetical protein
VPPKRALAGKERFVTEDEKALLSSARLDDAWPLIELFSTIRREHPDDCNRAARQIINRLTALGVPVTVYEPYLYLALPNGAHVEANGKKMFARPAPMSRPVPDGLNARSCSFRSRSIRRPAGIRPTRRCSATISIPRPARRT